jgi:hypothetical protein
MRVLTFASSAARTRRDDADSERARESASEGECMRTRLNGAPSSRSTTSLIELPFTPW